MKPIDMSDYNRAAKTFWLVMVVAGGAIFSWALYQALNLTPIQWAALGGLLSLVILPGATPIGIPNPPAVVTAVAPFPLLAVLFLGAPAAILIGCVDSFV